MVEEGVFAGEVFGLGEGVEDGGNKRGVGPDFGADEAEGG